MDKLKDGYDLDYDDEFKKINGKWFNLDSKLKEPEVIGSDDDFYDFLGKNLKEGTKELFLVVTQSIQDDDSWRQ